MPFTSKATDQVSHLGERALIEQIQLWLGPVSPPAPIGIGDDCAVVDSPSVGKQLLTVDSLTYGQHFDASITPADAGAKLIKRNLSDIAAMGGRPGPAVLALLCGPDVSTRWLTGFFAGLRATCEQYDVAIVGGDVSALPPGQFSASLTLTGTALHPKLRNSARSGDFIYVTGTLGGSILKKHYAFDPRIAEGRWLAERPECTAMMDLTDGLAKDLHAMLNSSRRAILDLEAVPLSDDAHKSARTSDRMPLEHAFCDGEDYELLFTFDHTANPVEFESKWAVRFPNLKLSRIGHIEDSKNGTGLFDQRTNAALPWARGFEHLGRP